MDKKEFEKKFKKALDFYIPYVIIQLRNASFRVDDYLIDEESNNGEVSLFWKGIFVGDCKIKSIKEVF